MREEGSQAAGIDRHAGGRVEDGARAQEQEHADEEVVDDADVEEHLRWRAWTAQKVGALGRCLLGCSEGQMHAPAEWLEGRARGAHQLQHGWQSGGPVNDVP